jgi:CRISP-associated protein Cas1
MASLILTGDTVTVNLESRHLDIRRRPPVDDENRRPEIKRVPLHDLDRVIVMGRPSVTIPVLQRLMREGIPVFFLSHYGRWIGSLSPDKNRNAARRIRQYEKSRDDGFRLRLSRNLIAAKIGNSRRALQRLAANRSLSEDPELRETCARLRELASRAESAKSLDMLRGCEGMAAGVYFTMLGRFFPPEFPFAGRSRRPPRDPANAVLSWTYTILLGEIESCLRAHGLDACIGFLHELSHGSPSLAVDLLEPLRAPVADLLALNMFNHRYFSEEDFEFDSEDGAVFLAETGKRKFFQTYETAMTRKFIVEKGEAHCDFRQIIDRQVCAVIRALEDSEDIAFFRMP